VSKGAWVIVTAVALFLGAVAKGAEGFVVAALILAVPYMIICRLAPRSRHIGWGGCNGTGEARSKLFPWAYHRCEGCNGTGRHIRLGARYVGPEHAKKEWKASKATQKWRHGQHTWR
jgi:hypothetical protein